MASELAASSLHLLCSSRAATSVSISKQTSGKLLQHHLLCYQDILTYIRAEDDFNRVRMRVDLMEDEMRGNVS